MVNWLKRIFKKQDSDVINEKGKQSCLSQKEEVKSSLEPEFGASLDPVTDFV
jgi:hypothetical protein